MAITTVSWTASLPLRYVVGSRTKGLEICYSSIKLANCHRFGVKSK